jgi:hypothetical protein
MRGVDLASQREFNQRFRPEDYARLLANLHRKCGQKIEFRVAEMPFFCGDELLAEAGRFSQELIGQLVHSADYLDAARERIPAQFAVPNEASNPLFVQADFSFIQDDHGQLQWRLVELQAFPSLYAFQPHLAESYVETYDIAGKNYLAGGMDRDGYFARLKRAIVAEADPEQTVLLEIFPDQQKTRPDFELTSQHLGIPVVCLTKVRAEGSRLFYRHHGRWVPIQRIYNRVIVDELSRLGVSAPDWFTRPIEAEWVGHPNWYFLISKFSLPHLQHSSVPPSWLLSEVNNLPADPEDLVLKPLYSFAGVGVKIGPTQADIDAVDLGDRHNWLLQQRMRFQPVIETPAGMTQAEVRVMLLCDPEPQVVTYIVRTGRGKMMGVDHNKNLDWVGASAALF